MESELNHLLLFMVVLLCGAIVGRRVMARGRSFPRGWFIVALLILVLTGLSWLVLPDQAGLIGSLLWFVLVLIPLLGDRLIRRLADQQRYRAASWLSRLVALLHPADGWQDQQIFLQAMLLLQRGEAEEAEAILERQGASSAPGAEAARLQLYRVREQWAELRACLDQLSEGRPERLNAARFQIYLRALGETGEINAMLRLYDLRRGAQRSPWPSMHELLVLFAFGGAVAETERLLAGPLGHYGRPVAAFWRATAALAAGDRLRGQSELEPLLLQPDQAVRVAAERRLKQRPALAPMVLDATSKELLAQAARELDQYDRLSARSLGHRFVASTTYGLIVLNLIAFGLELYHGGSTNQRALGALGALDPQLVSEGQWWRVIAAQFLHYGALHLLMNMGALLLLGRFVERNLGRLRFALVYLGSGSGAMLAVTLLTSAGLLPNALLVGASGGVMGLLGASMVLWLRAWRRERARIARHYFREMGVVLLLQAVMDIFIVEQTSFSAHLFGALCGALLAAIALALPRQTSQPLS